MNTRPLNIANTLADVLALLDRMAETGMMKPTSARFKKTALEKLTSVMADDEPKTPEWILDHVDGLGTRWANIEKAKPDTVRTYVSRAKTALEDYISYTANPQGFKPKGPATKGTSKKPKDPGSKSRPRRKPQTESAQQEPPPKAHMDGWRTFPLGKGREEFKYLLPQDSFTAKDVLKIACHLVTLAEDFDPMSPVQARMFALAARGDGE